MIYAIWHLLLLGASVIADKGKGGGNGSDRTSGGDDASPGPGLAISSPSLSSAGTPSTVAPSPTQSVVPSPAPALRFFTPYNATTCMTLMLRWQITPLPSNMTQINVRLFITNEGVQQAPEYAPSTSTSPTRRQLPSTVIAHDIANRTSLAAGEFEWPAVTVPEGWYVLEASPADDSQRALASQSERFFVETGLNTTCVAPHASTSPKPSAVSSPSQSGLSAGALAGTIVGTVVGLTVLLGAFILPRLWRRGVPGHQAWKGKTGGLYHVF